MQLALLIKGAVLGFSIAAPVGPIGLLCLRRSLSEGRAAGLATGLGAATADAVYGCVAGFGLTAVSGFLVGQRFWLAQAGGLFLCYLGVRSFLGRSAPRPAEGRPGGWVPNYLSTFLLTLTNPMTILSFAVLFASFGLGTTPEYGAAGLLVAGVFLGSAAWWLLLSSTAALFRARLQDRGMRVINAISGAVLVAFGLLALWSSFRP